MASLGESVCGQQVPYVEARVPRGLRWHLGGREHRALDRKDMAGNGRKLMKIDELEHFWHFPIYWEESSQLTFIFFRGVQTTNQS